VQDTARDVAQHEVGLPVAVEVALGRLGREPSDPARTLGKPQAAVGTRSDAGRQGAGRRKPKLRDGTRRRDPADLVGTLLAEPEVAVDPGGDLRRRRADSWEGVLGHDAPEGNASDAIARVLSEPQ